MDDFVSALRDRRPRTKEILDSISRWMLSFRPSERLAIFPFINPDKLRQKTKSPLQSGELKTNSIKNGGDERDRTADLLVANETLSQLSYIPTFSDHTINARTI